MHGARENPTDPSPRLAVTPEGGVESDPGNGASTPHVRDLAALLALPRMWRDRDPTFIAGSLLEVLESLLRLDLAFVKLESANDRSAIEVARPASTTAADLGGVLLDAPDSSDASIGSAPGPSGVGMLRTLRVPARLEDQQAIVVVASRRKDFPTDTETFLCRVAVEQAMLAINATRLVRSLTTANAAKSTFLATMSHELRTPLNAVIGYSELLQGEISGPLNTQQRSQIHRIEVAARHLLELIEGILNFARLEAGKEEVHLSDTNLAALAEGAMAMIEPLASAKGIGTRVVIDRQLPRVLTDEAKVRQILLNLLSNAVKFTVEGEISLEVGARGDNIECAVSDTGVGVSPHDLDRIFEPFQQVGDTHTHRAPGTGLGLSVSRQLARLLGGDVTAKSERGVGSTFVVRLPVQAPQR